MDENIKSSLFFVSVIMFFFYLTIAKIEKNCFSFVLIFKNDRLYTIDIDALPHFTHGMKPWNLTK